MDAQAKAFDCRRCGHCCKGSGGIVLTGKDQARLADHLALSVERFLQDHTVRAGDKVLLGVRDDGFCIFFDEGCGVHASRPDICRAWPFFRGNLLDESSWELCLEYCTGINPSVTHEEFVRQGLAALREQGVGSSGDPDAPCALRLDGIARP